MHAFLLFEGSALTDLNDLPNSTVLMGTDQVFQDFLSNFLTQLQS